MVGVHGGRPRELAQGAAGHLDVDHAWQDEPGQGWLQPEWEVDKDLIAKKAARDPS
jgi:hypothetical protein